MSATDLGPAGAAHVSGNVDNVRGVQDDDVKAAPERSENML